MIIRKNRFHGHHSVSRVRGVSLHGQLMSLRFAPSHNKDYRAAVVVSKKIDKRAVVRNRIRRRLFEIIRVQGGLAGKPVDIVVYAKTAEIATADHGVLAAELTGLIQKALNKNTASPSRFTSGQKSTNTTQDRQ